MDLPWGPSCEASTVKVLASWRVTRPRFIAVHHGHRQGLRILLDGAHYSELLVSCDSAGDTRPSSAIGRRADERCGSVADGYNRGMTATPTHPTRIDHDVYEAARVEGGSAAERINRWARIGRELEASASGSAVARVLAGNGSYDALAGREQAIVRAAWDERIAAAVASLDLERELLAAGGEWAEADDEGNLVIRGGE